jgi:cobalamin biosynthetic protein CobC
MQSPLPDGPKDIADHGGNLGAAQRRFPGAPRPWLDLSTGINAVSYPRPALGASAFERLPEESELSALAQAAAVAYGSPSAAHVVAAPGTQILLPLVYGLMRPGRAAVLSPTYAEHARCAALCGHTVREAGTLEQLADADLAIVVNPNNPDGTLHTPDTLLGLAERLSARGGLLVVDEAFMDAMPRANSVAGHVERRNIVVLRSFGKFFGLAGVRLGFALCGAAMASATRARLGPWAVSGPALAIGFSALADIGWQERMRDDLAWRASRLDEMLAAAGLAVAGGTGLFRHVRDPRAVDLEAHLGRSGILVRRFGFDATALRFGVPGEEAEFNRLAAALSEWEAGS